MLASQKEPFIKNFTELDDNEAAEKLSWLRDMVERGESFRNLRLERADNALRIWKRDLWDDQDKAFFQSLGIQPYQFPNYRTYLNALISAQRQRRFRYDIIPRDIHSFMRRKQERDAFVTEALAKGEFQTFTEAENYFDNYVDDNYAKALSAYLQIVRDESDAKSVEDDAFENGVITGVDFLKAIYSTRNNREGSVDITRVSQRAMVWDESSVEYDLKDAEFIGEIHTLYKDDLKKLYPNYAKQIDDHYSRFTNKESYNNSMGLVDYRSRYNFTNDATQFKLKLADLWFKDSEVRFKIIDTYTNDTRIAEYGLDEASIVDQLKTFVIDQMIEEAENNGGLETLPDEVELNVQVSEEVLKRFVIEETIETVHYNAKFTHDVLFEFTRSPFAHDGHPYTAFFSQFTDGYFTSIMDDIQDVIIAGNKARMFRELMLSYSAKGLLIVDQNALASSGYSVDDIAENWAKVGGVIALKLKPGQRVDTSIMQMTNTQQNIQSINELIADYDNQLAEVIGVNRSQLGNSYSDTSAARMKMELQQGQAANGIIFNNFERSLHLFYKKTTTLVVDMMRDKKPQAIRTLGDRYATWINFDMNENFGLFADAVRTGVFTLTLAPVEDDPQVNSQNSAQLMQLAAAGAMPLEIAFKYSSMPDRMDIVRDMATFRSKQATEQAAQMVNVQAVQQIAMQSGLSPEQVAEMVSKLQLQRYQEMNAERQKQSPQGQGMGSIQKTAAEPIQQQNIQQAIGT